MYPLSRILMTFARWAARGSWVTMTMVFPISAFRRSIIVRISSADTRSRSPVGLIGDQEGGIGDDGAGNGDPLLLAAGHLLGIVIHPVLQAHHAQRHLCMFDPFPSGEPGQVEGQLDVFDRLEHGDEVVELEDEPDVVGAPMGKLGLRKCGDVHIAHPDRAAVRLVDPGQEVQESRLPGARRPISARNSPRRCQR